MAFEQTTFGSILDGFAIIAGAPFDATTGLRTLTTVDKAECAGLLNQVVNDVWSKHTWPYQLLPSMTTKTTVTPTAGVIAWSDLDYSTKWSVWTVDPTTSWTAGCPGSGRPCYAREDTSGLFVESQSTATSLVVFHHVKRPVFTHVAWVTATAYVGGDVVLQGSNCYVCATAHTSGTFATDLAANKWTVQTLPFELREPMLRMIAERRAGDVQGKVAKTMQEQQKGQDLLDAVFVRASVEAQKTPWFVHNGGFTR